MPKITLRSDNRLGEGVGIDAGLHFGDTVTITAHTIQDPKDPFTSNEIDRIIEVLVFAEEGSIDFVVEFDQNIFGKTTVNWTVLIPSSDKKAKKSCLHAVITGGDPGGPGGGPGKVAVGCEAHKIYFVYIFDDFSSTFASKTIFWHARKPGDLPSKKVQDKLDEEFERIKDLLLDLQKEVSLDELLGDEEEMEEF